MKIKLLAGVLVLLMGLPLMAAPPQGKSAQKAAQNVDNTTYIAANKILMMVTNHGNFGRDLGGVFGNDYGTYFPFSTVEDINSGANVRSPYYAGGLWVGALDSASGDTLVVVSEYSSEYVPGPSLGGTFQTDRPEFRVYKLYSDSLASNPNEDYTNWPYDQGAPRTFIYDVDTTIEPWDSTLVDSVPGIIGDQFCWSAFNDFDPAQHDNNNGETAPLGLDIKQSVFAFTREDPLANIVFIKLQIYNNGDKTLQDCFFSIWSDPDLGGPGDDLVGTDTDLDLAFTYNATNSDQQYGSTPPSIGIDFFQGPLEYTGNIGVDSAKMWGTWWHGYINKGLYSFNKYINGTDPDDFNQTYQFMLGLDAKNSGNPYTNPTTGEITTYVMSGDPVAGTGWLDNTPADRRHMQTTGPITFRPGDSTEILCAVIVGRGGDRKSSISVMKYYDRFAQSAYEKDFLLAQAPAPPVVTVGQLDGQLSLTWTDTSEVNPGDYPFEGYTILQGESPDGPWTRIANYDVINGDAQILDEVLDPSTGALETRAVKFGTDSGIRRYFVVDQDYLTGSDLYNLSTYYFRVEAYSYTRDPDKTPKTLTSANRLPIVLIPQAPPAGVEPQEDLLSDIDVAHEGISDGTVTVTVLDPMALTGHDYSVTFGYTAPDTTVTVHTDSTLDSTTFDTLSDTCWFEFVESVWTPILCVDTVEWWVTDGPLYDTAIDSAIFWRLNDVTLGTIVIDSQFNQSGDDNYLVADGFICRVAGPDPGIASFAMISNASGEIDPPAPGAASFAGFPTPDGTDPVAGQQASGARWLLTTGDNGGTSGGGTRGTYAVFLTRTFRAADDGGARLARLGSNDFEWRFTDDGGWAWDGFNTGEGYSVPFEIWQTGIGTPDDPSDDIRLIPWILGDVTGDGSGDNLEFDLSQYGSAGSDPVTCHDGCEHVISGGDNDPYTDLVYWRIAPGAAPGDADYQTFATAMQTDPAGWGGAELPILDRTTLCIWNGNVTPPFLAEVPETGTTFRITTFKPNALADVFTFTAEAPREFANEEALDAIKAVPNPFYMFGPYDPAAGNYQIKFHHLPRVCSISIYNLAGDFISRIDKDGSDESGIATWNLQSDNRIPVASGIYIYVVDAPGFGQKIGKMAVFYEDEVLTIY